MEKNDIVTVVTVAGEFVGKYVTSGDGSITLGDPRMLVYGESGNMGFARGICMTGVENPDEATFQSVVFVTPTNEEIVKAYRQATTGLIT